MNAGAPGLSIAREVALKVILQFERGTKKQITELLDATVAAHSLNARDTALAHQLVLGVVRNWRFLEHALARFLRCPFSDTPAETRAILRLGAFQALCLDRIPDYALVDQSVQLAKKITKGKKSAAFVNAVLRALLREREDLRLPPEAESPDDFLSIKYSYPVWLIKYLLRLFGSREETRAFLEFNHATAPLDLRVNTLRISPEECMRMIREKEPDIEIIGRGSYAPETVRVRALPRLESRGFFRDGYCYVQDEAEQLISHVVNPQPGERIIDYCAAPGGKSTHLAELAGDKAEIVALDVSRSRLARVKQNCARLGINSVVALLAESEDARLLECNPADKVLVDAPCTGLGTLRRHPDIKLRLKPRDIERLQNIQLEILDRAARLVKPGGTLVYSTCTITHEENEVLVERFRTLHKDFAVQTDFPYLPPTMHEMFTQQGFIRTIPHLHKIDGVFVARLLRE
jgi:16S rRNA (cytosine967-C5)-methyltransferase